MAVPLRVQLFDAFLGQQEGIHSIILPDVFSSGGSKNLYINKYGRAKKVSGYDNQNVSAVTTDTGASAARLRALFPYRSTSGGSITRQLMGIFDDGVNEYELFTSTDNGVTWTFRSDLGSGVINQIPSFGQFGDNTYLATGKTTVRKWNGTTLSVAGRTQSPTPTTAVGAVGNLVGQYQYKLVTRKDDGTRGAGSNSSAVLVVEDDKVSLTWTADTDTAVVGYEVYRTTGTGKVYYFVDYVDLRLTAAYTDNTEDLVILENRVMEEHGDPPPNAYFAVPHKQRMWYLCTDTDPTTAWWSDPGLPEDVLDDNQISFSDSETIGDQITGGVGNYEGMLVVFTERAVWAVTGTGSVIGNIQDWSRTRTNAQVGTVQGRSVVRVPAGSKYTDQRGEVQTTPTVTLAYFTPLGDIRLFDGENDIIISHPMRTTLSTFNYANRAKIHALHDTVRNHITWFFPDGLATECASAVTWNYQFGVWYEWTPLPFACAVAVETSADAVLLLAGESSTATGGFCYQWFTGNSFNGTDIEAIWMTKALYGINETGQPAFSNMKRWRWADFLFEIAQNVTLTVDVLPGTAPDNGSALFSVTFSPDASTLVTVGGDTILTNDGDSILVAAASAQAKAQLRDSTGNFLHDEAIRLRVGDNASAGSWSLEALSLAYQILPGLNRRVSG